MYNQSWAGKKKVVKIELTAMYIRIKNTKNHPHLALFRNINMFKHHIYISIHFDHESNGYNECELMS